MQETNNALNCTKEGTCTTNMGVMNCGDVIPTGTSRQKRAVVPVQIQMEVTSEVKIPELKNNESESGNITMADIMAVAEKSVSEFRSVLDSLELAGQQLKKDTENGNFSVMVDGKRHNPTVNRTSMVGKLVCSQGTAQKGYMCVACSPGTYYNNTFCVPCPVATYQSQEQQLQCNDCPSGQTTADRGASTLEQCIVFCERGTYLESNTCIACPRGSYQPVFMQTGCIRCKDGFTTQEEGAIEESQCKATHIDTDGDDDDGNEKGTNVGLIVGVACSAIVVIVSIIIVIVICKRRGKIFVKSRQETSTSSCTNIHDVQELDEHQIKDMYFENAAYVNAETIKQEGDCENVEMEQIHGDEGDQEPET